MLIMVVVLKVDTFDYGRSSWKVHPLQTKTCRQNTKVFSRIKTFTTLNLKLQFFFIVVTTNIQHVALLLLLLQLQFICLLVSLKTDSHVKLFLTILDFVVVVYLVLILVSLRHYSCFYLRQSISRSLEEGQSWLEKLISFNFVFSSSFNCFSYCILMLLFPFLIIFPDLKKKIQAKSAV